MSSEAREIRQYAELAKAGHRIQFAEDDVDLPLVDKKPVLYSSSLIGSHIGPGLGGL